MLAVEVKQYVGEGRQTLVARLICRTAAAEDLKQTASSGAHALRRNWTFDEFRAAISAQGGTDATARGRDERSRTSDFVCHLVVPAGSQP